MSRLGRWALPFRIRSHSCYSKGLHRFYSSPAVENSELPPPRIDYRGIADNVVYKTTNAMNRKAGIAPDTVQGVVRGYTEFKRISSELNAKRNARSQASDAVRRSAQEKDAETKDAALLEAKKLKEEVLALEATLTTLETELLSLALSIPNDTHPSSPLGPESAAIILSTHGPQPLPADPARHHVEIGRQLNLIDFESGARVTGASWYFLKNEVALLELALTNYAIATAIKYGFTPVTTPDVIRSDIAKRCGFQPRDQHADPPVSQLYHLEPPVAHPGAPELILAGTAEIPLAGMFANKVFSPTKLPIKVAGLGRAFRAEAGSRGAETRGLYRVHQFTKVELFAVTDADSSEAMMEEMRTVQISILEALEIPFRVLDMPSEELGASAYRKYDIEAWMPGRGKWGEVASLSNCTDFQARRLLIRGSSSKHPTPYLHTLNGTAAAIPRLIVALLENGAAFNDDGTIANITLPEVLKPFWVGTLEEGGRVRWSS